MVEFTLNGKPFTYEGDGKKPLLWVLREDARLTGTRFGCGISMCGACTVHVDGKPRRACITPVSAAEGKQITTVEAIAETPPGKAVQEAWREADVVQCGWCQSGQIMSAAALLAENPEPGDSDIDSAMGGNLCRCATYVRIRAAIKDAALRMKG
ncbi:MAG: (2Fe-2S)-binding protein [Alphaproteobacteria bacterium]